MKKGYVQVYTGNGKGKTTAALGLSVRAACSGLNVYIGQFIKGMEYSELRIGEFFPNIKLEQYGRSCFIRRDPNEEDFEKAKDGLKKLDDALHSGGYDVVIADELNIAISYKLIDVEDVLDIIKRKPDNVELIITGRYADERLLEVADLVTEMKEVKHYYKAGVKARRGIEN
ncbi:MAG: cob(I)yrinic acid a,c-diamide adenosyltransferase [Tissierellia bacterium]|nr:cob(I)yrinic acid a,c-diamide adenosyltransferase [Tissierellia bacterium]